LIVLGLGFATITLIKWIVPTTTEFFTQAFFAFILLPPPFVLPLFIKKEAEAEMTFFSELLIYYTVMSFIGYIVLMSIF
ncbi:MAG: hypothetical protein PF505_11900, partial [Vallitaleaceae bacterium]|nr:hypothetical protein [Vallitaleaceae bacterium]